MKLIRELRMGPTKSFKTGAVVGTYPKPMLVLMYDESGINVIPSQPIMPPGLIQYDLRMSDIVTIKPNERAQWFAKPMEAQPKVLCIDFTDSNTRQASLDFRPVADSTVMTNTINICNELAMMNAGKSLPWKSVVIDPISRMQDGVLSHLAVLNPDSLKNAMQWAGTVGTKVQTILGVLVSLPCHFVAIFHSQMTKDEKTGMIVEGPLVYGSGTRDKIGGIFSQIFYATTTNNKPVLWTVPQGFVKGIGCQWPLGLAPIIDPDFHAIYGKEGLT